MPQGKKIWCIDGRSWSRDKGFWILIKTQQQQHDVPGKQSTAEGKKTRKKWRLVTTHQFAWVQNDYRKNNSQQQHVSSLTRGPRALETQLLVYDDVRF